MATVTITIPDQLADQAKSMGLLDSGALSSLLRDAVRDKQIAELFDASDKLAALDLPVMTSEEVEAEISAVRAERRARRP